MGFITINKIGVELPIYHSIRDEGLNIACGHVERTSLPIGGESTHSVLSAHRGLPHAKLFTELDKREIFTRSIDEIVKLTPNSYSHLALLFKRYINMPLIEYLKIKRIEYAKGRLSNTNDTTLDICMDAGYSSLSYFNHAFKSITGKTPSEYRKYSKIKP